MGKLKINLKMDIVAVAICPVVETLIGSRRSLKTTEPLDEFISIEMFNEMIELYNEKHKGDLASQESERCELNAKISLEQSVENHINKERCK